MRATHRQIEEWLEQAVNQQKGMLSFNQVMQMLRPMPEYLGNLWSKWLYALHLEAVQELNNEAKRNYETHMQAEFSKPVTVHDADGKETLHKAMPDEFRDMLRQRYPLELTDPCLAKDRHIISVYAIEQKVATKPPPEAIRFPASRKRRNKDVRIEQARLLFTYKLKNPSYPTAVLFNGVKEELGDLPGLASLKTVQAWMVKKTCPKSLQTLEEFKKCDRKNLIK